MNGLASQPPDPNASEIDRELFRHVIGHFASGVTVVTAHHAGVDHGMTASAVASLSLEPPMLVVCLHRQAPTQACIASSSTFGVNILAEGQDDLAERFATPQEDKFRDVPCVRGRYNEPLLRAALARIECEVQGSVDGGTHRMFLARVTNAQATAGTPLTYYRGRFGRLALAQDELVYQDLRRLVLDREISLGEALDLNQLAEEGNHERASVYNGLTRLAAEGLVERRPNIGFVVEPIDAETSDQVFEARRAIELGVVDSTIGRVHAQRISELGRLAAATAPYVVGGRFVDLAGYMEANTRFHEALVSLADTPALLDAYRRLSIPTVMARTLYRDDQADDALIADHRALVEAYELGDRELAAEVIDRHTALAKALGQRAIARAGGKV